MFCPTCGTRVATGTATCPTCGTSLAAHLEQVPPPPPPPQGLVPPPPPPPLLVAPGGLSQKSKMVAGLLQIFLGAFGAGRFYTGHTALAIGQIAATWLTCGIGWVWPFIDGIMMLAGKVTDSDGRPLRD
jgi:TM2 domain-containing membrane protein YozV